MIGEEIISNFHDIFKIIEKKYNEGFTFFRGHSDEVYRLNSTIYRNFREVEKIYAVERELYEEFNSIGYKFIPPHFGPWDKLMLMQHYGVPTRLLDWTENFSVALYFAFEKKILLKNEDSKRPSIYMLNPLKLNKSKFRTNLYEKEEKGKIDNKLTFFNLPNRICDYENYFKNPDLVIKSFALYPNKNNERIISQSGVFTVQCKVNSVYCLEEEAPKSLFKIIFDESSFDSAIAYLRYSDINIYRIYNDMDNLSKYIRNRFQYFLN